MRVTVAICTWNRARLLDRTLAGLGRLELPRGLDWEILVVDNNSTDETASVIARHAGPLPLRGLFEPEPGLSRARNRAIGEASGDLVVWTDDDVIVDKNWLAAYVEAAGRWPDAAFFGGPIHPEFEAEVPAWVVRDFDRIADAFAILDLGPEARPLEAGEFAFGANMAFRASALPDSAFDVGLGSRGLEKTGCDETELQSRLRAGGKGGVWVGSARVGHIIPADRLTPAYLRRCYRGRGQSTARIEGPPDCPYLLGYPRYAVRRYLGARLALARRRAVGEGWAAEFAASAWLEGYLVEAARLRRAGKGAAS